jgi:hypothetical protein
MLYSCVYLLWCSFILCVFTSHGGSKIQHSEYYLNKSLHYKQLFPNRTQQTLEILHSAAGVYHNPPKYFPPELIHDVSQTVVLVTIASSGSHYDECIYNFLCFAKLHNIKVLVSILGGRHNEIPDFSVKVCMI